jgi:hypothetical protein
MLNKEIIMVKKIINWIFRLLDALLGYLFAWIFEDVIYAIIPILIVAIITALAGKSFEDFLLIKEWSFASIVLFGVAIRKLIRIKVKVQLAGNSDKLHHGVQFLVVSLIASTLILSIVIMAENNLINGINVELLTRFQMALFAFGMLFILSSVVAERRYEKLTYSSSWPKWFTLKKVRSRLVEIEISISQLLDVIDKFSSINPEEPDNRDLKRQIAEISSSAERVIQLSEELKAGIVTYSTHIESATKNDVSVSYCSKDEKVEGQASA